MRYHITSKIKQTQNYFPFKQQFNSIWNEINWLLKFIRIQNSAHHDDIVICIYIIDRFTHESHSLFLFLIHRIQNYFSFRVSDTIINTSHHVTYQHQQQRSWWDISCIIIITVTTTNNSDNIIDSANSSSSITTKQQWRQEFTISIIITDDDTNTTDITYVTSTAAYVSRHRHMIIFAWVSDDDDHLLCCISSLLTLYLSVSSFSQSLVSSFL